MIPLNFCRKYSKWTVDDWRAICWTDESPFKLFLSTIPQNDRIRWRNSSEVTPQGGEIFPQIMVWGMMSHQALRIHIIPPKQTVNASYYVSEILLKPVKMH